LHELQGIYNGGLPCYHHNSIVDLLNPAGVTWKYYARDETGLWTAPNSIYNLCGPDQNYTQCQSNDWNNNVKAVLPNQPGYSSAPIPDDIAACRLPNVSRVIPDGNWSDHAGGKSNKGPGDGGPSWVAAIVNAVIAAQSCDSGAGYWSDSVILVTWDDWGGYYDDVVPPGCVGPGHVPGITTLVTPVTASNTSTASACRC
jgi:phospholipase C